MIGEASWNIAHATSPDTKTIGDLGGNVKSRVIVPQYRVGSVEIVWTGTPAGTITIYASNSHRPSINDADAWNGTFNSLNGILNPSVIQPAGSAGSYLLLLGQNIRVNALYIDYARTSGSGTIKASYGFL